MRPLIVVMLNVFAEHLAKVTLRCDERHIKALPPATSDPAFRVGGSPPGTDYSLRPITAGSCAAASVHGSVPSGLPRTDLPRPRQWMPCNLAHLEAVWLRMSNSSAAIPTDQPLSARTLKRSTRTAGSGNLLITGCLAALSGFRHCRPSLSTWFRTVPRPGPMIRAAADLVMP